jgi:hypothetical protein
VNKQENVEVIEDGFLFTTRIEVPGGWIYRSQNSSAGIMGICFVPFPYETEEKIDSEGSTRKRRHV